MRLDDMLIDHGVGASSKYLRLNNLMSEMRYNEGPLNKYDGQFRNITVSKKYVFLIHLTTSYKSIIKFDKDTLVQVAQSAHLGADPSQIIYANGYIYVQVDYNIIKIDPATLAILNTTQSIQCSRFLVYSDVEDAIYTMDSSSQAGGVIVKFDAGNLSLLATSAGVYNAYTYGAVVCNNHLLLIGERYFIKLDLGSLGQLGELIPSGTSTRYSVGTLYNGDIYLHARGNHISGIRIIDQDSTDLIAIINTPNTVDFGVLEDYFVALNVNSFILYEKEPPYKQVQISTNGFSTSTLVGSYFLGVLGSEMFFIGSVPFNSKTYARMGKIYARIFT